MKIVTGCRSRAVSRARCALLGSIAAVALFPSVALAQDAQAQPEAENTEGDIIVRGSRPIAESEAAALIVQRNSDSLVSVAASDAIGRLPDQNIAQAAGRLPGVAVQRDQGQARYISLRGAPINWTTLAIDGISIVSPEGRDTRYDSLPSALASQIIVRKAVTPDMTGETVAGQINIRTRSAFDYKGLHAQAKLGGGYVELGSRQEYEGQLVLSDRWSTGIGEIGVLLSGSYYQRDMVTDNFENDWEPVAQDVQPGNANRIWARETENKLYRLTRKNYSYSGRLDWEPVSGQRFFVQSIFTTFTDDEARDNYIFDLDDRQGDLNRPATSACAIVPNAQPTTSGYADVCIGNTPLLGTVYGIDINQRATLRAFEQSIFTTTIGGDQEFDNGWNLSWRANYTRAKDDRSVVGEARYDSPSTRNLRPTVSYDLRDRDFARIRLFRTITTTNPTTFRAGDAVVDIDQFQRPLTSLVSNDFVDITKAYTGKFDVTKELDLFGGEGKLMFGFQFDQRTKEANEIQYAANTAQATALGISTTFADQSLNIPFKGEIPLGYSFRYFDLEKMRANVRVLRQNRPATFLANNFYNVREQVYAGYFAGRVGYDWGSVLAGARVEHIKNRGSAFANGNLNLPVTVENDITLVYPSLHVNYDMAEDKKLRVSFNTGAARPDYDQLRPNFTFNDQNLTISGGNPFAKPEKAYGVDAYFEWYIQPQGYISVGVFYKRIEDVLFDQTRTFNSDALDSGGVDRSQYLFTTIGNGGKGHIFGAEIAVQTQLEPYTEDLGLPDWMGGFGLSTNFTFNDSSATTPDGDKVPLPGTSDIVYNLGVYYEKYGLSVRANYQKRTDWLDGLGSVADGGDFYWTTDDELDVSARYAITPNVEVYFDASNLLNQPGRRFVRDRQFTIEWERFGRRYTGGVRVTF
ncbi:MAG: TonB-dependent receptor [Sphingomonadales bacterium RIFCSPHIGHO2_01_FULL_65_20]|jgi:TonB-dependent receptor|uniref:TonB-dependent receptor n=1 Tax=Sphingomonas ursincola TaxID=56361 RepID=A0A7V8U9K1_9SPHN|nr:TonB-dependent receptor [Sphingomonas ursincola]MBA4779115.1 TonB-dependent receptor [Blastomonas sp.]OHC96218.1 MAG: TonB-dependent receptor [Sphingomonadales bacterium RIFCSPHIGHO2_01_FULL_65_20]MBA1375500.1 TonB-dependent receptor [Sphingomonas ursincola]MBY0621226.1 TonB-dependent receptor [Sphingomonas ursincola]MCH2239759.1 TonB-dependent receptor [Blastomonas sp.]